MSTNIEIKFDITTNFESVGESPRCHGTISFTNTGMSDVTDTSWEIYFCSVRIFEPDTLRDNPSEGVMFGNTNLKVYHINGCMHKISPTESFSGFIAGDTIEAPYQTADWQVARTDISPNWYFAKADAEPRTILSTRGQSLDFVGDFTKPEQWKRQEYDTYDPYTPQAR